MKHLASRRDALGSLIFDMEPRVRSLVGWGEAFTALGTAGINPTAAAIDVMAAGLLDLAQSVAADWERCFALSVGRAGASAPASTTLLRLVREYEAAHQALDAETARLDRVHWREPDDRHVELCRLCGQRRGDIALLPSAAWPDVLLKVRAFGLGADPDVEDRELCETLSSQKGHGYLADVAQSLANDLLRLRMREALLCA